MPVPTDTTSNSTSGTLYNPSTAITATPNANTTVSQQTAAMGQGFSPVSSGNPTPISADSLGKGTTPVTLPPVSSSSTTSPSIPPPSGAVVGSDGRASPPPQDDTQKWIKNQLMSNYNSLKNEATARGELQNQQNLATKTQNEYDTYNAYIQAQKEQTDKINEMRTNPQGRTIGQVEQEISDYKGTSDAKIANLALFHTKAQGDLAASEKIINDKMDAQFAPIKDSIDFLSKFASINNNDLTDSQKEQMTLNAEKLKTDNQLVQTTATDLHKALLQNNAPASVYSAIDKITNDFVSGKISAVDAQSQMSQAAGTYGQDKTKILDTQYKQVQMANMQADTKKKLADIANGSGDSVASLGEQLVRGMLDPSQLSKRTTNYNAVLKAADDYSMSTTGKHYDIAKSTRDFKYASNIQTQNTLNYLGSLTGGVGQTGNLDELVNLSNSINRTEFPALNKAENWAKLETGDPTIASYHAVVTEVADQVGKILQGGGTGSGTSDAKLNQALSLFQSSFTKDQIVSTVNALKPLLNNRAKNMIGDNPYLSDYADKFGFKQGGNGGTMVSPDGKSQVKISDLTPEQIKEAKNAGWK